jgi:hypothetical protein
MDTGWSRPAGRLWVWFVGGELALYLTFLCLDLLRPGSGADIPFKYLSILLCLLFSLTAPPVTERRLVSAALAFTLLADTFLLVLNRRYTLGVALFCVVQLLYLARILLASKGRLRPTLVLVRRAALAAAALALLQVLGALSLLNALSGVYFTQLLANGAESLTLRRRGRPYILFSIGLFLFIGCDICVGLHNLVPASAAGAFARVGMWLFYLPSQVLLTLSACRWTKRK